MYLTISGRGAGVGFELESRAKHELFEAEEVVQRDGTSKMAWYFAPAKVRVRVGDLKVMV
jgi:hypothetical protein